MPEEHMKFDRVLVPIDGSVSSDAAVDLALHSAEEFSATLEFVYVVDSTAVNRFGTVDPAENYYRLKVEGEMALKSASKLAERKKAKHREILAEGVPWEVLAEMSKETDMMILSVTGRSGMMAGKIGTTAKKTKSSLPLFIIE